MDTHRQVSRFPVNLFERPTQFYMQQYNIGEVNVLNDNVT